jgi:uncharacterized protein YrzB (UPF0473 family)
MLYYIIIEISIKLTGEYMNNKDDLELELAENVENIEAAEEEYEADLITLEDENGNEHCFEVLDAAEVDDVRYMVMVPYNEDAEQSLQEDAEMIIMRLSEEDGEEILDIVDDDEELKKVSKFFMQRLQDVFDIDISELEKE